MGIGDKTLGFLRSGQGNPTIKNIEATAKFFRVEPWQLLRPMEPAAKGIAGHQLSETSAEDPAITHVRALVESPGYALSPATQRLLQRLTEAAASGAIDEAVAGALAGIIDAVTSRTGAPPATPTADAFAKRGDDANPSSLG